MTTGVSFARSLAIVPQPIPVASKRTVETTLIPILRRFAIAATHSSKGASSYRSYDFDSFLAVDWLTETSEANKINPRGLSFSHSLFVFGRNTTRTIGPRVNGGKFLQQPSRRQQRPSHRMSEEASTLLARGNHPGLQDKCALQEISEAYLLICSKIRIYEPSTPRVSPLRPEASTADIPFPW